MCAGLWHRQASALPTHFIHPCWQPVYYSHSAAGACLPNTLPKQRLRFETGCCSHCHRTPECTWCIHTQTSPSGFALQHHGQLPATLATAAIVSVHIHTSWNIFWQPAARYALTCSHFRPCRWSVPWPLWAFVLSSYFFSLSLFLSFVPAAIFNGFHVVGR